MQKIYYFAIITLALGLSACGGDFRQKAQGQLSEVVVVMDSSKIDNVVSEAIRDVYGEYIRTMPRPEPRYDLRFRDFKSQTELQNVQRARNIIIAGSIDEETNVGLYLRSLLSEEIKSRIRDGSLLEIPLRDRWYKDQWILIYTGTDEAQIADRVKNHSAAHLRSLSEMELDRWTAEVYRRGEVPAISDSLWTNHGFRIRVQHDYTIGLDSTNFVTLRRYLEDNDRWIWFWWKDDVPNIDFITENWIHATRDSLLRTYIRGSRPDSYIRTDYRLPLQTQFSRVNNMETYQSKGVWVMSDFSMGGPFISYVKFDEAQQRLYFMEFAQFSPRYRQRRFLYQFEAIARTFETNPDYFTQQTSN
jgi:hypothetical protein